MLKLSISWFFAGAFQCSDLWCDQQLLLRGDTVKRQWRHSGQERFAYWHNKPADLHCKWWVLSLPFYLLSSGPLLLMFIQTADIKQTDAWWLLIPCTLALRVCMHFVCSCCQAVISLSACVCVCMWRGVCVCVCMWRGVCVCVCVCVCVWERVTAFLSVSLSVSVCVVIFVIKDRFVEKADVCLNLYPCVIFIKYYPSIPPPHPPLLCVPPPPPPPPNFSFKELVCPDYCFLLSAICPILFKAKLQ